MYGNDLYVVWGVMKCRILPVLSVFYACRVTPLKVKKKVGTGSKLKTFASTM